MKVTSRTYLTQLEVGSGIFTFFATLYCISHRPSDYRKAQRFYIVYGGILLVVAITDMAFNDLWGQYMWIDYRNHPGGPLGFYAASQHAWYTVIGFGSDVTGNILGDALLVCHISPPENDANRILTQQLN